MLLFIVARHQLELYDALTSEFAKEPKVQIIVDRRIGERRREHSPVSGDRRQRNRRARVEVDAQLRSLGWALVTKSVPPTLTTQTSTGTTERGASPAHRARLGDQTG